MSFSFHYDKEFDILAIYKSRRKVKESIEVSENIVLDLNKKGQIIGIEIMDAGKFFRNFNSIMNNKFLSRVESANISYKSFRNQWIILVNLKTDKEDLTQPMPPLRKSRYISPLFSNNY